MFPKRWFYLTTCVSRFCACYCKSIECQIEALCPGPHWWAEGEVQRLWSYNFGGKETVRDRSRSPLRYDGPDPAVKPESHSAWRTAQVLLLWHCFEVFVWEWFSKPTFSSSAAAQVLLLVRKRWGLFPNALAVQAHVLEFEHERLIGGLVCCLGVSSCFNSMVLGFILFASPARLPSIPRWIWKWRQWRRWESTWKWQWGWGEPREEGSDWWWSHGWQEGGEELVATCSNWYCNLTIKFLM